MAKKDRRTYQKIAGDLVEYLRQTQGADEVYLETSPDGEQAFRWLGRARNDPSRPGLPCRMPVWAFERFEGVHEWHIESTAPTGQQGELF